MPPCSTRCSTGRTCREVSSPTNGPDRLHGEPVPVIVIATRTSMCLTNVRQDRRETPRPMTAEEQEPPDEEGARGRAGGGSPSEQRRAALREPAERLRAHVQRVVDAADPEGLLDLGAPPDEYDPEVDDLTRLVRQGRVSTHTVLEVWERWFGPGSALQRHPARLEQLTEHLRHDDLGVEDQVTDLVDGDRLIDGDGRVWARKHGEWLSASDAGRILRRGGQVARYSAVGGSVRWLEPDEAAVWWAQAKDHLEGPGRPAAPPDGAGLTYGAQLWRSGRDRLLGVQDFC